MKEINYSDRDIFSDAANKKIEEIDTNPIKSYEYMIKLQEARDKSRKLHSVLESWATQKSEERKLRKLYALCFMLILIIQIILLNVVFVLIGRNVLNISEVQFNVFFVSMFGEITAFALIVTKYLFNQEGDVKTMDAIKEM